jgi:hypothetical protein
MTDKKDPLTQKEFETLITLCKKVVWSSPEYRKKIQAHRVNVVPANFYSNIPLIDDIEESFEYRPGVANVYNHNDLFNEEEMRGFIGKIAKYANEFNPPDKGDRENPKGFYWENPAFSFSDAMSYYCVVRHFQPDHIVEVGSGYSTFVADQALKKNGKGKLTLIEPYPMSFLNKLETVDTIIESKIQDIPKQEVIALIEDCDIWFIDSTHTVKIGSDCLYIYLVIMPEIQKDIIVHTHDIMLPFGFSKSQALNIQAYWTEQYLLYAYMLDNPKIRMLFGSHYAKRYLSDELDSLMLGKYPGGGGSVWYELNGSIRDLNRG